MHILPCPALCQRLLRNFGPAILAATIGLTLAAPSDPATDLYKAIRLVEPHYATPLAHAELYDKALNGLLQELDKRSRYLSAKEYAESKNEKRGSYAGIGIITRQQDGRTYVAEVGPNGPAALAGLGADDQLLAVDGKSIEGMSSDELVQRIRGEIGSLMQLRCAKADGKPREAGGAMPLPYLA